MYFKDSTHQEMTNQLMQTFGFKGINNDRAYGAFCYVATATYKIHDLQKVCDPAGIDLDELEQMILVYSSSEISLIRFALQLFNNNIDDITLPEVMTHLDDENKQVIIEAIKFRFRVQNS